MNLDFACEELKTRIETDAGVIHVNEMMDNIIESLEVDMNDLILHFFEIYGCTPAKYSKNILTGDVYKQLPTDLFIAPEDEEAEDEIAELGIDIKNEHYEDTFDI